MADRSQKALSDFVSEAQETIDALAKGLMRLEGAGAEPEPELLNSVFRAAHSLKGLSSMFGVERLARLAHALEDALDDLRMGRRRSTPAPLDLLLEAPEVFSRIISEESTGAPHVTRDVAAPAHRAAPRRGAGRPRPRSTIRSTPWRSARSCAGCSPSTRSTGSAPRCARGWRSTGSGWPSS